MLLYIEVFPHSLFLSEWLTVPVESLLKSFIYSTCVIDVHVSIRKTIIILHEKCYFGKRKHRCYDDELNRDDDGSTTRDDKSTPCNDESTQVDKISTPDDEDSKPGKLFHQWVRL